MKKLIIGIFAVALIGWVVFMVTRSPETEEENAQSAAPSAPSAGTDGDAALAEQASAAILRGVGFLLGRQMDNGSWLHHPAITSLACTALAGAPNAEAVHVRAALDRALDYVVALAQPDGSIWNIETEHYPNYSTSVSLIALAVVNRPQDLEVIRAARTFLLGSQFSDVSEDDPAYGGIGYGKMLRPDLSNTQWALEALHLTEYLDQEPHTDNPDAAVEADLAWGRAREYLRKVQNLPEANDAVWVASDPENIGGFVYMPGESKAGEVETEDGTVALRSYGSMTYAGLKSLIYAKLNRDNPHVQAAVDWIRRNYTWERNPGMEMQGYYYYVHTASKALAVLGEPTLTDDAGDAHDWRADIIRTLLARQHEDGHWSNEEGRWWESTPELVTSYSLIALEIAHGNDGLAGAGNLPR